MAADKNSSPNRELGLCPKFTTKDSHTSLSSSRSHNGPTNPRNNPKQSRSESTNQEAKDLTVLQYTRRTVRGLRADPPRGYGRPFAGCGGLSKKWSPTTSTAPSITDRPRWARGPSAPSRTIRHFSTDRPRTPCNKNPRTQWIERKTRKNSRKTRRTLGLWGSSRTVCHVPADCPPGEIPAARARPLEGQLHLPFARSPESTKGLLPIHRWRWSVSMRCCTYEL
jgi:hypothetical protein